jgi:DNA repair protein RadA/Sms
MAKSKTIFVCQACGVTSPKWIGRCPSCGEWNSYVEEVEVTDKKGNAFSVGANLLQKPLTLDQISTGKMNRFSSSNAEFDRVLGGGIVPGSMILLGGEPGIGKSTLALQVALSLVGKQVLYISGEESLEQIKLRSTRLESKNENCLFLCETSLENILAQIENIKPDLLVIDSIQTVSTEMIESSVRQGSCNGQKPSPFL